MTLLPTTHHTKAGAVTSTAPASREEGEMKSFVCEVSIHNTFQQAEVEPVNIEYRKWAGRIEPEYDLAILTISDMPVACFTEETIADVLEQARHDHWLTDEIDEHLRVDRYADEMDRAYDRMVERRMGCM